MQTALNRLPVLIATVGAGVAATGLIWRSSGDALPVVTTRGQSALVAGDGLYEFDTVFSAAGNVAVDAVVLVLGVPLLLTAWWWHRSGSPRGSVLLAGSLGFLLYVYATYAVGVAYNPLFLAYVVLFSAALFGVVAAFVAADRTALEVAARHPGLPHRLLAGFLVASAVVTTAVWLPPLVTALVRGTAPDLLDVYTTPVTSALDLAVITPAAALAGLLVRRRDPLGYLLAAPLLVTIVLLLPTIALSTALQSAAGISFTAAEVVGPIAGFGLLGVVGIWLLGRLLRAVPPSVWPPRSEVPDVHVHV